MVDDAAPAVPAPRKRSSGALRTLLSLGVLAVVFLVLLPNIIDYGDVWDAITSLGGYELVILLLVTMLKWAFEGWIYAAVLPSLGVGRGTIAYLASTAAVNTVPGPVDLAVRFGMYRAWGYPAEQATAAVVAGGLFSTMAKLVLPGVAMVVATLTAYRQDGLGMYALIGIVVALGAIAFVIVLFRSETHARSLGDAVGRFVSRITVRFGRRPVTGLGDRLAGVVAQSSTVVRARWPLSVTATVLATGANYIVLLLSLRFAGVPASALPWEAIFVSFATVQFLTVVPITSGNVGVSELVYIGTMGSVAGSEYQAAVVAGVMIYRLFTWLLVIPVGWLTLGIWQTVHRRHGERVDLLHGAAPTPEVVA
jgi:uncharacterized membrane protein YbhN (UPF0104 family)